MSNDTAAIVCASAMAAFFACFFGYLLWKTRARADPELDRVYAELAVAPAPLPSASRALGGMRSVVRAYIVLGAIVTALGLAAILQDGLGFGSSQATLYALIAIVVVWAAAVPFVLRQAREATTCGAGAAWARAERRPDRR